MAESIVAPRAPFLVRILLYWAPVLMAIGVMYYFSTDELSSSHTRSVIGRVILRFVPHASNHVLESFDYYIRKSAHVFEYGVLAALLFRAFRGDDPKRWLIRWAIYAWVTAASWAMLDEFHQTFTRSRDGSIRDVLLDSFGALIGLVVFFTYLRKGQTARSSVSSRLE